MTPEAYVKPPIAAEFSMAIVIVISIGATCGILLFGTLFHRFYESRKFKAKAQTGQSGDFNSTESTRLMDTTTGSGRGTRFLSFSRFICFIAFFSNLARRTIAKDLSVSTQDAIGQGIRVLKSFAIFIFPFMLLFVNPQKAVSAQSSPAASASTK